MLHSSTDIPSNESPYIKPTKFNQNQASHHGLSDSRILLGVPSETLTGITAYLNPPSLLSLAKVHSRLALHVKNDNTWHRAFVCQFLGISPESEIHDDVKSLMLRRSESSWRIEFIVRYKLRRRWERSRNPTIAHIPVHSEISSIHMMPNFGLLASSVRYGIVSRSLPLNGKILSGYLDASGLRLGLGVGNPNAEFIPDVSTCAITSDGGTAKIFWGFRHGEVGILTAPRAIDAAKRPVSEFVRCEVDEEHVGAVVDAVWDDPSTVVATGGADGAVKLWDTKTVRCLWTSERNAGVLMPDACCKVAVSVAKGLVAVVMTSGEIVVWTGFHFDGGFSSAAVTETRISLPVESTDSTQYAASGAPRTALILCIDTRSVNPTILTAFEDDSYFYRLSITQSGVVETTTFGDAAFGSLSCISPFFSHSIEPSFILTGDRMGCVSVYAWDSFTSATPIQCVRKFEAHEDGAAVTALAWNGITLITGSDRGTTYIWDGLTFEYLRSFASPVPRVRGHGNNQGREIEPVNQILIGPENLVLLVSVGNRVLAWMAGIVPKHSSGGVRGRHTPGSAGKKKKDKSGAAKFLHQLELHQTIAESKSLLKQESEIIQRTHGRVREHLAQLENLGLNEAEAVEYILMLSRDEAQQRSNYSSPNVEEGIFENFDFDDVSPNSSHIIASSNDTHFPPICTSVSPPTPLTDRAWSASRSSISRTSSSASQDSVSGRSGQGSLPGSPQSGRSTTSAWAAPLRPSPATPACNSPSMPVSSSSSVRSNRSIGGSAREEEMDEELRFVLELSLAEARSRGDDV
ncbi:F-box/WD repeat-containing protein pof10 [Termitomyces sp. J132]|nr:F-box/WD repeat-containing protein pof10 [Termitomyces sp. J132]